MHKSHLAVDMIFTKLSLVYGRDFLSRWEGIDLDAVKADWAHELGGLLNKPQAIKHALTHLPAKPPNVVEFSKLCLSMPEDTTKALPLPKIDKEGQARIKEMLAKSRLKIVGRNAA